MRNDIKEFGRAYQKFLSELARRRDMMQSLSEGFRDTAVKYKEELDKAFAKGMEEEKNVV